MRKETILLSSLILFCIVLIRIGSFFLLQSPLVGGQKLSLQGMLGEEPRGGQRGQQFAMKNANNQTIYIQTGFAPVYHYGDSLAITGTLQVKTSQKGRVYYQLNFPHITKQTGLNNPLLEASSFVRKQSMALFEDSLPPISASLLSGIVYGAKEEFPDTFTEQLQNAGVLHVIAASGANVSFVVGALMFSLGTFLKRRTVILLAVFGVIFYSFLVGFEPSIIRASIMALIVFAASLLGRPVLACASLFMSGVFMLLWQPAFLLDVGFQLSFLATLGILMLREPLVTLSWFKRLSGWGEDIATTIAAEVMILPILLSVFGKVGILSVVVNALVLWTVPVLMVLGSVSVLVGLVFAPFGKLVLFLCLPLLLYFEKVVSLLGGLGWNVEIAHFPWQLSVAYYLLFGALLLMFRRKS